MQRYTSTYKIIILIIGILILASVSVSYAGVYGAAGKAVIKNLGKEGAEQTTKKGAAAQAVERGAGKAIVKGLTKEGAEAGVIKGARKTAIGGDSRILASRIGTKQGFQAHHILPVETKNHRTLNKIGFDMDCAENGILLPSAPGLHPTLPIHRGYHASYSHSVIRELDKIPSNMSEVETRSRVMQVLAKFRKEIESGKPLYESQGATGWK